MSDYTPKHFTDAQRDLFASISRLNRQQAGAFFEADRWIDTKPKTEREQKAAYLAGIKKQGRIRRGGHPTACLDLTGEQIQDWRRLRKLEIQHNLLNPFAVMDEWANCGALAAEPFFWFTTSVTWLKRWRRERSKTIRHKLEEFQESIQEEDQRGPLHPHEIIDIKATRFIHSDDPLVFDAMNHRLKSLWARRLLRIVWILTDTAELTTTDLAWLRDWKWGEKVVEMDMSDDERMHVHYPRLWLRVTTLDREMDEWEQLSRAAMRALEEAEPGATATSDKEPGEPPSVLNITDAATVPVAVAVPPASMDVPASAPNDAQAPNASEPKPAVTIDDDSHLAPRKLAELFQVPYGPLRFRLARWRKANDKGWIENPDRSSRDPLYLFRVGSIRHIIYAIEGDKNPLTIHPA